MAEFKKQRVDQERNEHMANKMVKTLMMVISICIGLCITNTKNVIASENEVVSVEDLAEDEELNETEQERYFSGENKSDVVTGMDENGNIYTWTEDVPEIEGVNPYRRTTEPLLVDFHTKSSTVVTYYTEFATGRSGYTNGAYGADALYLGMVDDQVKFMLAGVTGLVNLDEVRLVNFSDASSYSYYSVNSSGRLIHYITTNLSGTGYASKLDNGPAPSYLESGKKYLSYDGHYFYDQYAVMQADCNEGHRNNAINAKEPYYNYYQFLPFRSASDYTAAQLDGAISTFISATSKMKSLGDSFITYQDQFGINALLAASIAANESAWGDSNICQTKNNLFGINAIDSSPGASANTFSSPKECVKTYMETYLSKRYCRPGYTYYNGAFLGNKASGVNVKYASDPYWGEKAAAIAWRLDKVNDYMDSYKYTIGIKDLISTDHTNVNVRHKATTQSTAVFKTGTQSDQAFLILDEEPVDGFYKIQSPAVLDSSRTSINSATGVYSDFQMYLYISADYVDIVSKEKSQNDIEYNAHVSNIGWQFTVSDGQLAGTTGKAYPIEALSIRIDGIEGLGVSYRTHVRNIGWQEPVTDGEVAGTTGKALSVEALEISLTGENADKYDVYYSTHVSNIGWLDWAKNGEPAGSSGYAYPVEALKIQLVEKGAKAPGATDRPYVTKGETAKPSIQYEAHLSNVGWMDSVKDGAVAGKENTSNGLEAFTVELLNIKDVSISYKSYVQGLGWQNNVTDGDISGTTGQARYVEAISLSLIGEKASIYDVYYRTYVKGMGWLDWAKNGESAGTYGYDIPVTAIQVMLQKSGEAAPGNTENAYLVKKEEVVPPSVVYSAHVSNIGWMDEVSDGETAGTTGKALSLEALKIELISEEQLSVDYSAHVRNIGWMSTVSNGAVAGTTGRALSMEAIKISLSGAASDKYDIYYRVHSSNLGWLGWAKNGESAGSAGYAYPMESIEICIVEKGGSAPGSTEGAFVQKKK